MPARRDRYHHGDLRRAAVEAAIALVEESGHEAFTVERVARRVGVTAPALYRHFDGRDALLKAVIYEVFLEFVARVDAAVERETEPAAQLRALGVGYVDFALEHPGWFRLQFSRAGVEELLVPHAEAQPKYPMVVFAALGALLGNEPALLERAYLTHWATAHGISVLLVEGMFAPGLPLAERQAYGAALIDQSLLWTRVMDPEGTGALSSAALPSESQ